MPRFYTVDRQWTLSEGLVMSLTRYDDVGPPEIAQHLDMLFPDGVTQHGETYLVDSRADMQIASPVIELLWENVRRSHFPTAPSRFQSVFAVDTLEAARAFRQRCHCPCARIWVVESSGAGFHADMNLLTLNASALRTNWHAHQYWSHQESENSPTFWEFLLRPPVKVLYPA
jgi:hypothetical protein